MKKLFSGVFKLVLLIGSVLLGFTLAKKLKEQQIGQEKLDLKLPRSKNTLIEKHLAIKKESELMVKVPEVKVVTLEGKKQENTLEIMPSKIEQTLENSHKKIIEKPETSKTSLVRTSALTPRQKTILAIIEKDNIVEMKILLKNIKGVTERTLRRDLLQLQNENLIKKIGTTKSVKYQLISK